MSLSERMDRREAADNSARNSRLKRGDLILSLRVYCSLLNWVEGAGVEFTLTARGETDFDHFATVADGMCADVRAAEGGGDELAAAQ